MVGIKYASYARSLWGFKKNLIKDEYGDIRLWNRYRTIKYTSKQATLHYLLTYNVYLREILGRRYFYLKHVLNTTINSFE